MRILVYGAGVIGANLAADLYDSGRDVTILARGEWAQTLERRGLVINPLFSLRKRNCRIPAIRELKADDAYDVIFVVMRYGTVRTGRGGVNPCAISESPRGSGRCSQRAFADN